jgi:hypothetical protein
MSSNARNVVGAAAAAAFAIAPLIIAPPAQADHDCYKTAAGYQFPGGQVILHYPETDSETKFDAPRGTTVNAPAETFYKNGTSLTGRVTGEITKGGNIVRLTVTRGPKYDPLIIDGAVGPDDTMSGSFAWKNHDRELWDSPTPMACIPGAPVEDLPLPAPAPAPAGPKPVAPDNAGTAPTEAQAAQPQQAAPAQTNESCIPDPFDLNFPGAC